MPLFLNRLEATLFLLGLSGIAALFLPFAVGWSPLREVFRTSDFYPNDVSDFLRAPILLPIPISVISFLHLVSRRLARPMWIAAYTFGFCGAALVLALSAFGLFNVVSAGAAWLHALLYLIPTVVLIGGGVLVVRNIRGGVTHAQNAINTMQVACVPYAVTNLVFWFGGWDVGAYVAIFAIVVYASHVVLAPELARRQVELKSSG